MESKNITITEDALLEAYKNGNADQKNVLEQLFDKEIFLPKSIMDRVKTFEDAVNELGENHLFVIEYRRLVYPTTDHLAYMKLRIITAALNEGWEPTFEKCKNYYYPYFCFYTEREINLMSKKERNKLIPFDVYIHDAAHVGVACTYSNSVPTYGYAAISSRLCFRTRELAEYAGKQFIDIFYDFYIK